jgi:hypothetical protein
MDYLTRQTTVIPAGLEATQHPNATSPYVYRTYSNAAQVDYEDNQGWTFISIKKKKKTQARRRITEETANEYQSTGGKSPAQLYLEHIYQVEQDVFKQRFKNKNTITNKPNKIRL